MHYLEVLVADQSYHGDGPLTYSSESPLAVGQVVIVPLRRKTVVGIVVGAVKRPTFAAKLVLRSIGQPLPAASLALLHWLSAYYPSPSGIITQQFVPQSLKQQSRSPALTPAITSTLTPLPALTSEQRAAVQTITKSQQTTYLLHGDTGTGKTRVYLELAAQQLDQGRSVLVLTPEIGLTPQLEAQFRTTFGQRVLIMHSQLTPAERRKRWLTIVNSSEPVVVIGARSALFSPIQNLGLIVIDEAHETAYKQEQAPYYHAFRVAAKLAELQGAKLVLGTATPAIQDYYLAEQKKLPILRLTQLPLGSAQPTRVQVVALRDREQFSRRPHLSNQLLEALQTTLQAGEQAIVFLNRRGTARLVLCQLCGWQALCPNCDLPLTYHADSHQMRCHTCGHSDGTPSSCPVCQSTDIVFKSIGTKSIADELAKEFPKARIQRFDTDNLKAERLEQHYSAIQAGKVDILVGTQLLAKGLDLPKLSLVGVVVADTSLYFPDFTAEERTYQLLSQVIGRVGRGHRPGTVIVQSYNPDSPAIQAAIHHQWPAFYKQQLQERQAYLFPPFCYVLKLTCRRRSDKAAMTAAQQLIEQLATAGLAVRLVGPAPAWHEKVGGYYHWQIVVKAKQRAALLHIIKQLPAGWLYDIDPINLL